MEKQVKVGLIAVVGVLVLGLGWWLGSPLFRNTTVHEAAPSMAAAHDAMMKEQPAMADKSAGTAMMGHGYSGMFVDGVTAHHASGKVMAVEADGKQYLRFTDFAVTNGPDLYVVLVKGDMAAKDGMRVGALKGNQGEQNYELPAGTDLMAYNRIVIWCKSFNVTFGTADLKPGM